ncbi:MAG: hypothetical protein IT426_06425 [Pirellulales bacterium]|nr:hypothetical protein [Pirellulales bacterium]
MKGMQGLILAVVLGIVGAVFNLAYLMNRSSEKENVYFIGLKRDMMLNPGDKIKVEQIETVGIPKNSVGNLRDFAVLYESDTPLERHSVVGDKVERVIKGGRLLLKDDFSTPPPELKLEPDESAMFVPIDTRSIVTSLIVPGDQVMFLVSKTVPGKPTPAAPPAFSPPGEPIADPANAEEPAAASSAPIEKIGPFKVLSIGNRLGTAEVMKSARIPQQQENVMTIGVKAKDEAKALYLQSRLEATNYRQVGVRLLPRQEK